MPPRGTPRGRSRKGNMRMDAAIDALVPLGFSKGVIRKKVNELLKVYDGEWIFIEEASYKLLIETILEEQGNGQGNELTEKNDDEQKEDAAVKLLADVGELKLLADAGETHNDADDQMEEGIGVKLLADAGEAHNDADDQMEEGIGVKLLADAGETHNDADDQMEEDIGVKFLADAGEAHNDADDQMEEVIGVKLLADAGEAHNDADDQMEEDIGVKLLADAGETHNHGESSAAGAAANEAERKQPTESNNKTDTPSVPTRKPSYGWLVDSSDEDYDDDDTVLLETVEQYIHQLRRSESGKERKSRWDVPPDHM